MNQGDYRRNAASPVFSKLAQLGFGDPGWRVRYRIVEGVQLMQLCCELLFAEAQRLGSFSSGELL